MQPPSAGFIVQLFVVPGLIVLAVIGVWLLFGKLASSDTDWQSQVEELRHPNRNRRWRGALGLAQMLKADQERGESGQHLASQPEIAQTLSQALSEELKRNSQTDDDLKYQAFLARTLGLFDMPAEVLPVLRQATHREFDREVRKNALGSIALIANRKGPTLRQNENLSKGLVDDLIATSLDEDTLIRQTAAFTLGLVATPAALDRLFAMLSDTDANTQANAAIGLARNRDRRATPALKKLLAQALEPSDKEFEKFVATKNAIAAVGDLSPVMSDEEKRPFHELLTNIGDRHKEPKIANDARGVNLKLKGEGAK